MTETRANGSVTSYVYEATTSRLKTVTDPKLQVTTYTYFADGQLQQTTYTNVVIATPSVSFTYDAVYGRVATMVDGTGTTTYGYNPVSTPAALGATRLASVDGPLANDTITYQYDELGRVVSRAIDGAANPVTWTFDALGRTSSETNLLGAFTSTYEGTTGRVATVTYPSGQTSAYSYLGNSSEPGRFGYLTSCDYNVVMTAVRIAELKSRLSEHLRSVRKGRTLTVLDRDTPIARIVPYAAEPIEVRRATRRLRDLELPPPPASPTDSLAVLLDDRRRR